MLLAPTGSISGVGAQIAWYEAASQSGRRQKASDAELLAALHDLDGVPVRVSASAWPGKLTGLDLPGLYSWWADKSGAAALSRGLSITVPAGRIYAGLTGAAKWPSGAVGKNTLRRRVGGSHIRGRIRGESSMLSIRR